MSIHSINHVQLAFPTGQEAEVRRIFVNDPAGNQLEFLGSDSSQVGTV